MLLRKLDEHRTLNAGAPRMLRIRDIMTTDVVTLSPDLSLRDAMDILTSRHITGAPVASGCKVIGVISLTDLAEYAAASPGVPTLRQPVEDPDDWENAGDLPDPDVPPAAYFAGLWDDAGATVTERFDHAETPEWNALEDHTVGEAMTRRISALPPDAPVDHAAGVMRRAGIHRVLVMEGQELLGVLTTTDIASAVADQRFHSRTYVFGHPARLRGG
jgi:CBS domain-containing protein